MVTDQSATAQYANLLSKLPCLFSALSAELRGHNEAIAKLDLPGMEQRLANEQAICGELINVLRVIEDAKVEMGAQVFSWLRCNRSGLFRDVDAERRSLFRILRTHRALTKSTWRSIRALYNICNIGNTYSQLR